MKSSRALIFCFIVVCATLQWNIRTAAQVQQKISTISYEEQLLGLCRLWGVVKYFHPAMVYNLASCDSLLITTLPQFYVAKNSSQYRQSLEHFLSLLNDPYSFVVPETTKPQSGARPSEKLRYREQNDIVFVTVPSFYPDDAMLESTIQDLSKLFIEAQERKGIVLDLRNYSAYSVGDIQSKVLHFALQQSLPYYLQADIDLPFSRFRTYRWYCPQSTYEFTDRSKKEYENCPLEFVFSQGTSIHKKGIRKKNVPLILLTNTKTLGIDDILSALQSQCGAIIINEGNAPPPMGKQKTIELPYNITCQVRISEYRNDDGTNALQPDIFIADSLLVSHPDTTINTAIKLFEISRKPSPILYRQAKSSRISAAEEQYKSMLYPSKEYRLLALFRLWNVIHYFFPYKHLMDTSWETTFLEFVPKLEAVNDSIEYARTIAKLVARLQDSHAAQIKFEVFANTNYWGLSANSLLGTHYLPIQVEFIEGNTVITGFAVDSTKKLGLQVGDIITHINGQPIEEYRTQRATYFSFSTPQAAMERIHAVYCTVGQKGDSAQIVVRRNKNTTLNVVLPYNRKTPFTVPKLPSPIAKQMSNIGYIDLTKLPMDKVDSTLELLKSTKGIILDMRGYPMNGTMWKIASRLAEKPLLEATFAQPLLLRADLLDFRPQQPMPTYSFEQWIFPDTSRWRYTGKIVVLIDAKAISQAEHTCLVLEAAANVTFVGSPTNGTDGTVTYTVLPGGIEVPFTGQEVRHADGRQLQRIGIQPHVFAAPTIAGIRAGRDEVLEKGVEVLREMIIKKK